MEIVITLLSNPLSSPLLPQRIAWAQGRGRVLVFSLTPSPPIHNHSPLLNHILIRGHHQIQYQSRFRCNINVRVQMIRVQGLRRVQHELKIGDNRSLIVVSLPLLLHLGLRLHRGLRFRRIPMDIRNRQGRIRTLTPKSTLRLEPRLRKRDTNLSLVAVAVVVVYHV